MGFFKNIFVKSVIAFLCVGFCMSVEKTHATDGYFSHGYGTAYKSFAGAGTALFRSSLIAAFNPAGIAFANKKIRFDVSMAAFSPARSYAVSGDDYGFLMPLPLGKVESGTDFMGLPFFIIPSFGMSYQLDTKNSLGIVIYGNGGMNTSYDTTIYVNPDKPEIDVSSPTGVNMSQLFIAPVYSRKIHENHALGIGPIIAYQSFEAYGLEAFDDPDFSLFPGFVTNNGVSNSFGAGVHIGYQGRINKRLSMGAAFQSPVFMSAFEEYKGLFADEGDFDIPMNWNVGAAFELIPEKLTLIADFKQIRYSSVNSVGNPMTLENMLPPHSSPNPEYLPLGSENGVGFGWEDMNIFKGAMEYKLNPKMNVRGGYSFANNPVPKSEVLFNILAPGVINTHISGGFSYQFENQKEITLAVTYALPNQISGENPMMIGSVDQNIELEMKQLEFEIGFSF